MLEMCVERKTQLIVELHLLETSDMRDMPLFRPVCQPCPLLR